MFQPGRLRFVCLCNHFTVNVELRATESMSAHAVKLLLSGHARSFHSSMHCCYYFFGSVLSNTSNIIVLIMCYTLSGGPLLVSI